MSAQAAHTSSVSRRYAPMPFEPHVTLPLPLRFGVRIRDLRMQQGLTQRELGKRLGIDRSYLSEIERGTRSIGLSLLEMFAVGYGLPVSELLRDL